MFAAINPVAGSPGQCPRAKCKFTRQSSRNRAATFRFAGPMRNIESGTPKRAIQAVERNENFLGSPFFGLSLSLSLSRFFIYVGLTENLASRRFLPPLSRQRRVSFVVKRVQIHLPITSRRHTTWKCLSRRIFDIVHFRIYRETE